MIALCEMISSLRQSEIRALRAQYSLRERNEQDLRGKLLDLVLEKKEVSDEIASKHIYNTRPGSAFSHLKNRLWEDICSVLALQGGGMEAETFPEKARVSQLVNVARVLKNRQLYKQSFEMSQEALALSLKHSFIPELMLLKDFISLTFPDFWMRERTRVLAVLADSVKQEAERLRAASLAEYLREGNYSQSHVAELESLYRSSSCQQIRSIVHRSMINIHLQSKDKEKLMNECIQLYRLALEPSSDPEQKKRNAIAFTDITKAALHVRSFDSAIAFGKAGLEFVEDDLILKIESYENLLIAYLNTSQFNEAEDIIQLVDDYFARLNQLEFKRHFHYYLKAWYYYLTEQYKSCLKLIAQLPPLPKEKEEWHAGFYILEMLSLLKTKTYFQIDYRNEAFRKFQVRHEMRGIPGLDLTYKCFKLFIDSDYEIHPVALFLSELKQEGRLINDSSSIEVVDVSNVLLKAFSGAN